MIDSKRQSTVSQSGSALLATVMVVAVISVMLGSLERMTRSILATTTKLEDAAIAFSAAEAGIEEGLLRARFDKNIEAPLVPMQAGLNQAVRVHLTTGTVDPQVTPGQGTIDPAEATYDLRIWYKAPVAGDFNPSVMAQSDYSYRLYKDQSLELDVADLRGETLTLRFRTSPSTRSRVETVLLQTGCTGDPTSACVVKKQLTDLSTGGDVNIAVPAGSDNQTFLLRIKPLLFEASTLTPAPADSYIVYAVKPEKTTSLIDAGRTFVESTGYFGQAKRKLVAEVDRKQGTVLGIYDYTVFTQGNLTK